MGLGFNWLLAIGPGIPDLPSLGAPLADNV